MDEAGFKREMTKARTFRNVGERPDYWLGYERGQGYRDGLAAT